MRYLNILIDRIREAFLNRKKLAEAEAEVWRVLKILGESEEKNRQLLDEALRASAEAASGIACVEAVMKRGIEWFDYANLDFDAKLTYYNDAQSILKNWAFVNECDRLKADWARFCMAEARDFEGVRDMRMCVNALELVVERLGSIEDPRKRESKDELHADL